MQNFEVQTIYELSIVIGKTVLTFLHSFYLILKFNKIYFATAKEKVIFLGRSLTR